jgi:hypothetical protein
LLDLRGERRIAEKTRDLVEHCDKATHDEHDLGPDDGRRILAGLQRALPDRSGFGDPGMNECKDDPADHECGENEKSDGERVKHLFSFRFEDGEESEES